MLAGDNGILQRATDAKQTSERAEAKEQAQMDIMAYIADKTTNHQDPSLDDTKVKDILTEKSYVKEAGDTSFTTKKGEYIIPYSELYTSTGTTPTEPTQTKYGLSDDGTVFIGKPANGQNGCNGNVEFADGQKFTSGHFLLVENYDGFSPIEDAYFVWDADNYEINSSSDLWNGIELFDIYYASGEFYQACEPE